MVASSRGEAVVGAFIVRFSGMQAEIEDAIVRLLAPSAETDVRILLAGQRGPEAGRTANSFRHLMLARVDSDSEKTIVKAVCDEIEQEHIPFRNRVAHDSWKFSPDEPSAEMARLTGAGVRRRSETTLAEVKSAAERCVMTGFVVRMLVNLHLQGVAFEDWFVINDDGGVEYSI